MDPALIVMLIGFLKDGTLALMKLYNTDTLTKADLETKSPKEILAEMGIDLDNLPK